MYSQLTNLLKARYSCRNFSTAPVSDALVESVIESARLAPSACNRQPWTFIAVRDEKARHTMLAKSRPAFNDAPVVIVACGHHDQAWHRPSDGKDHTDVDLSIAIEHICLAATALGLATCWVCSFDTEATRDVVSLPPEVEPIALIPLGFSADTSEAPAKIRKDLDQILRWEKY